MALPMNRLSAQGMWLMVESDKQSTGTGALKWGGAAVLLAAVAFLIWRYPVVDLLLEFVNWLGGQGTAGMVFFGFAYFTAGMIMLPMFPIGVLAGMTYGLAGGLIVLVPGAVVGATLAGWLGSSIFREPVLTFVRSRPAWRAVCDELSDKGLRAVVLNRLAPVLPFGLQNYLLGAVGVKPLDHCLGTLIGMQPALLCALYLGTLASSLAEAQAQIGANALSGPRLYLLVAGGVAVVTLAVWLGRVARSALQGDQPDD